jgi:hypothetical protein
MLPSKKVLIYEVVGTLFIIFLGSAFHFTYELSGRVAVVGAFSAVNESVWEHLKLPFWPSMLWMLIEIFPLRKAVSNFFTAKSIGTIAMIVIIPAVFYAYTAFTQEILAVDIATFMIAVIVGQIISYRLFKKGNPSKRTEIIAIIVIFLLAIIFASFTFYPPHLSIFQDSNTGQYGIAGP